MTSRVPSRVTPEPVVLRLEGEWELHLLPGTFGWDVVVCWRDEAWHGSGPYRSAELAEEAGRAWLVSRECRTALNSVHQLHLAPWLSR